MNIKDLVEVSGYRPRRKAATHGGEYCSPCPFCKDGDDRFLMWPYRQNKNSEYQGGRFACRICGKYGDAITFLRELQGLSYKEACQRLHISSKQKINFQRQKIQPLLIAQNPPRLWVEKATSSVDWCHAQLMNNAKALKYIMTRGLSLESLQHYKIGFCPNTFYRSRGDWGLESQLNEHDVPKKLWLPCGIVVPTFNETESVVKLKIRRSEWQEGDNLPKYVEISGSKRSPSIFGNTKLKIALILESELDALLMQQYGSDLVYCIALGGSTKSIDQETYKLLLNADKIFFCPDYDDAGLVAWSKWEKMFPNINLLTTPEGKGAGDAYLAGVDLRLWLKSHLLEG